MTRPSSNAAEIRKIRHYVRRAEAEVNKLGITPRFPRRFPFDCVGLATLSKAFALSKACLELLESRLPDEAYGLCRSVVECATNLRYLTADPDLQDQRTHDFVKFAMADKSFWMHYALQQFAGRKEEQEILEYRKQQGIVAETKSARRHWSGVSGFVWFVTTMDHPLDAPGATPNFKKAAYAADYYQTGSFVHCSVSAVDNYFAEEWASRLSAP